MYKFGTWLSCLAYSSCTLAFMYTFSCIESSNQHTVVTISAIKELTISHMPQLDISVCMVVIIRPIPGTLRKKMFIYWNWDSWEYEFSQNRFPNNKTELYLRERAPTFKVRKTMLFQSSFLTALGNFAAFSGMASKINQKYLIFASTVASMSLDLRDYIVMVTFCLAVMSKCNSEEY